MTVEHKAEYEKYEFTLEPGIAIPLSKVATRYPWRSMAIGDSFFVPYREGTRTDKEKTTLQTSIGASARACTRDSETKFKIITRRVEGGIRVWRVE